MAKKAKLYRIPVEQFDDMITQMSCPVVQKGVEEERKGMKTVLKGKKKSDVPNIQKFVSFEFVNASDEENFKKLKGL